MDKVLGSSDVSSETLMAPDSSSSSSVHLEGEEYPLRHDQSHLAQGAQKRKLCYERFTTKKDQKVHQHAVDRGERRLKFLTRDTKFSCMSDLQRHGRVRSREQPFKCEVCSRKFTRKCHLVEHVKTVHVGEKKWKCWTCGNVFGKKTNLQRHERLHTGERPFKCEVCSKIFTRKYHLLEHVKTVHAGERKWKCRTCGSAFGKKTNLQRHERVHTGERPYECKAVGKDSEKSIAYLSMTGACRERGEITVTNM